MTFRWMRRTALPPSFLGLSQAGKSSIPNLSDGQIKAGIGRERGSNGASWRDAESPSGPASWRRLP